MLSKLSAYALIAIIAVSPIKAFASCEEDTIDTLSDDGELLVLESGQAFDVSAGDSSTSAGWSEGDTVLMCGDIVIDKDQGGEKVEVTPH